MTPPRATDDPVAAAEARLLDETIRLLIAVTTACGCILWLAVACPWLLGWLAEALP